MLYVQPYLAPAVLELAEGLPSVCDEHNHERALRVDVSVQRGRRLAARARCCEIERTAVRSSALVTTTTEADRCRHHLGVPRRPGAGRGDAERRRHRRDPVRHRRGATGSRAALIGRLGLHPSTAAVGLFIGSGHAPNIDAGRSLIHLAPTMPQVDFLLAGRHSDELHRSNLPPNVHLLGTVPEDELELLLGGADMALNPIHTGGGSNLKLLTYLAAGLPVITSAVGARGIDAANAGVVVSGLERLGDAIERVAGAPGRGARRGRTRLRRGQRRLADDRCPLLRAGRRAGAGASGPRSRVFVEVSNTLTVGHATGIQRLTRELLARLPP